MTERFPVSDKRNKDRKGGRVKSGGFAVPIADTLRNRGLFGTPGNLEKALEFNFEKNRRGRGVSDRAKSKGRRK